MEKNPLNIRKSKTNLAFRVPCLFSYHSYHTYTQTYFIEFLLCIHHDEQNISQEGRDMGGVNFPDFKLYYNVIVIKTAWYWNKDRPANQWNRDEYLDRDSQIYNH